MLDRLRERLMALSPSGKRVIALFVDLVLIWMSLWLAFFIRLGWDYMVNPLQYYWLFLAAPALAFPVFIRLGLYRAVLRYIGRDAIITIFNTVTLATLLLALVIYLARSELLIPRSMVFNYWLLLLLLVGSVRFTARAFFVQPPSLFWVTHFRHLAALSSGRRRVAIYGAGTAGFQLYRALQDDRAVLPVAFIDDNPNFKDRSISGVKVYGPEQIEQLLRYTNTEEVLLAIPSLLPARRREILEKLEPFPVHVRTVPSINELATGRKQVNNLREIDIGDILGREVVKPVTGLMGKCIHDQVVVVTGAGGSIGAELCRQIVTSHPRQLILFDHSEYNLFLIEGELRAQVGALGLAVELVCVLGSVLNPAQLKNMMRHFSVDTVYHAAAYKHVPMVERNITAGIRNNVFGTLYAAQAAIETGVSNFVLVSTDKAVRPTSIMGATKRLAEMILQALADEPHPQLMSHDTYHTDASTPASSATRFTMVRFGNVLDSSGSVIPRFRQQIQQGGPLTVTHPNITRYFMTIPEAAQLVIQAGAMGRGGALFVLDMGQPIKILDLAVKMVHLAGLSVRDERNPQGDIEVRFAGLRPGEKLYEELLIDGNVDDTDHPMIKRAFEEKLAWDVLKAVLTDIQVALDAADFNTVRALLAAHIHGFQPDKTMVDWMVDQTMVVAVPDLAEVEQAPDSHLH